MTFEQLKKRVEAAGGMCSYHGTGVWSIYLDAKSKREGALIRSGSEAELELLSLALDGLEAKERCAEYNVSDDYENHWKPLLHTGGEWDAEKIKNEMHDLIFVHNQVAEVYGHITGGKLSKALYYAKEVTTAYDDEVQRFIDEGYAEAKAKARRCVEELEEIANDDTLNGGCPGAYQMAAGVVEREFGIEEEK